MKRTLPIAAAVLALTQPIHLGEAAATDAAVYVAQIKPEEPRAFVQRASRAIGWTGRQWRCVDALVYRESRWHNSANRTSSARGYFQLLKMPAGTPIDKQFERFTRYINSRYGTPCAAYAFHVTNGWY